MRDVKLVRLSEDGTHLVLAHEGTGEEFALRIDDRIRGAVVSDRARIGQLPVERPSRLRPKEIQARLRAGESSEEIAAAADVPLERILRYAGPVLAERQYIAEQARRCVLRRQAGEAAGRSLDQVVSARLESYELDPDRAEWDAWRAPDGRWVVAVIYQLQGEEQRATFSYDPAGRLVVPSDDAARAVVEGPKLEATEGRPGAVHGPAPRTPRDGQRLRLAPLPSPQASPEVFAVDPDTGTRDSGTRDSGTRDSGTRDSGTRDSGTRDADVRPLRPAPARPAAVPPPPAQPAVYDQDDPPTDAGDAEDTVDLSKLGSHPGALTRVDPVEQPVEQRVEPVHRLRPADPQRPQERAPDVLPDVDRPGDGRPGEPRPLRPERTPDPVRPQPLRPAEPEPAREPVAVDSPAEPVARAVRERRMPEGRPSPVPTVREAPAPAAPAAEESARSAGGGREAGRRDDTGPAIITGTSEHEAGREATSQTDTAEETPKRVVVRGAEKDPEEVRAELRTETRRGARAEPEAEADTTPDSDIEPDPETEPEPAPKPKPVRRPKPANANAQRKRASRSARKGSVPSWDDILFGGKK